MSRQEWEWFYSEIRSLRKPELRVYAKYVYLLLTDRPAAQAFYDQLFRGKEETVSIN